MIYAIYTCITIIGSLNRMFFSMFKFGHPDLRPHSPCEKNLKIPKGQSETVYRRRRNNTMAKRKCAMLCTNLNIHCNISIGGF